MTKEAMERHAQAAWECNDLKAVFYGALMDKEMTTDEFMKLVVDVYDDMRMNKVIT